MYFLLLVFGPLLHLLGLGGRGQLCKGLHRERVDMPRESVTEEYI